MFNDDIFDKWLDKEANKVLEKLNGDEALSVEDKMILTLKAQTNHFYHLDIELKQDIESFRQEQNKKWEESNRKWDESNRKWEEQNKKWNESNKKFDAMQVELSKMYQAINSQTWKMIGAVGFIVLLGRLIENFGK